jgi:hypothetical protein
MLIFVVACTGNGIVAAVFMRHIKPMTATTKFILSLAVTDFSVGMSSGLQIFYLFYPHLSQNIYTCLLRYQFVGMMTFASQLTASFTTLDRYIAICHHTYHSRIMKPTVVNSIIIFLWLFSFTIAGLPFIHFNNWNKGVGCVYSFLLHDWIYLVGGIVTNCMLPISIILYGLILKTARRVYTKSLKKASEGPDSERNRKIIKNIRSAKVMGYVTLAMIVSWTPFKVYQMR